MIFTIAILIKTTLVCFATIAILLLLRRSSATLRHWVISLCLLGVLLMPVLQYLTPTVRVEIPILEELATEPPIKSPKISTIPFSMEATQQDIHNSDETIGHVESTSSTSTTSYLNLNWKQILLSLWLLGVGFFLIRILLPITQLHQWRKNAIELPIPSILPNQKNIKIYRSEYVQTPMTFGWLPPKILLPNAAQTWSAEQLNTVLLHEWGHIQRKDYLLHLLGLLTLSLYWFHPLVWLLQKWQQQEREKACDEFVLRQGIAKTQYAESLVQVARNMLRSTPKRWNASLPMAAQSETKQRIVAILKFDSSKWRFNRWLQWRWVGIFACITPVLAAIHLASKDLLAEVIPEIETVLEQPVFSKTSNVAVNLPITTLEPTGKQIPNVATHTTALPTLNKPIPAIESHTALPSIQMPDLSEANQILGWYGTWGNHNDRHIQVYTKGTFEILKDYPYFTNLSDDAVIVIKWSDRKSLQSAFGLNRKEQTLVITKAAFDGWLSRKNLPSEVMVKQGELLFTTSSESAKTMTAVFSEETEAIHFMAYKATANELKWQTWMQKDIANIAQVMKRSKSESFWKAIQEPNDAPIWNAVVNSSALNALYGLHPLDELGQALKQEKAEIIRQAMKRTSQVEDHTQLEAQSPQLRYGKLEVKNKSIEIWTRGNFRALKGFPYFDQIEENGLIIVRVNEKKGAKKCCKEIVVQRLKFDQAILVKKSTQSEGVPIPAGVTLYNYNAFDGKSTYTISSSEWSGFKVSHPKKMWNVIKTDWEMMSIEQLTTKIKADSNFLQPMQPTNEKWQLMAGEEEDIPGLQHVRQIQGEKKWQDYLQSYFLTQFKLRNASQSENMIQVRLYSYLYVPSGELSQPVAGKVEKVSVQGFHISATEISNKQYRTFLAALELEGNTALLAKARIHNENFIINGKRNEAWAATYHRHPAFDAHPVVNISYEGAKAYCNWLTQLYSKANKENSWNVQFRLPTEKEWMYAARGGLKLTPYPWGGSYIQNNKGCDLCNYRKVGEGNIAYNSISNTYEVKSQNVYDCSYQLQTRSLSVLAPVVSYFPNNYGIYNTSGNVAEMLQEKGRTKGGSWNSTGYYIRIDAEDEYAGWEEPSPFIGFRPVVTVEKLY